MLISLLFVIKINSNLGQRKLNFLNINCFLGIIMCYFSRGGKYFIIEKHSAEIIKITSTNDNVIYFLILVITN